MYGRDILCGNRGMKANDVSIRPSVSSGGDTSHKVLASRYLNYETMPNTTLWWIFLQ